MDVEDWFAPFVLFELGLVRWRVALVNEFFLGGEIGMGSGRFAVPALIVTIGLLALGELDDALEMIECEGDFSLAALAAALDSESEPESQASSSPHSLAEANDHREGAFTPLII